MTLKIIQKIKVFECEIDNTMTQAEIIKIFKKINNVQFDQTRDTGCKSISVKRGAWDNYERFSIFFINKKIKNFEHSTYSRTEFGDEN